MPLRCLVVENRYLCFRRWGIQLYPSYLKCRTGRKSGGSSPFSLWFLFFRPVYHVDVPIWAMVSWWNSTCCRLSWWMGTSLQSRVLQRVDRSNRVWNVITTFKGIGVVSIFFWQVPSWWTFFAAGASMRWFDIVDLGVRYHVTPHQLPETFESHGHLAQFNNQLVHQIRIFDTIDGKLGSSFFCLCISGISSYRICILVPKKCLATSSNLYERSLWSFLMTSYKSNHSRPSKTRHTSRGRLFDLILCILLARLWFCRLWDLSRFFARFVCTLFITIAWRT